MKKVKSKNDKLSFKDLLEDKLIKKEFSLLKKSYDLIGKVAILEIDRGLLKKKKIIGKAIIDTNKHIKSVVRKVGGHEGDYRVQKYEFLVGEKNLETLYKESGVSVKLDIREVYFTPRLSNERLRVAKAVKKGENVLVMFSGVGIFPFIISKYSKAKEIYGVEINPSACKYADESLRLNKFKNIKLFCGDVRKVVPKLKKKFDRILMPLPATSLEFLDLALKYLKKNGIIHLYCFSEEELIDKVVKYIKKKAKIKVLKKVKAGQQSPRIYRYCVDFKVNP